MILSNCFQELYTSPPRLFYSPGKSPNVDYSQISYCISESYVTNYLQLGENSLTVIVPKWCDGSYRGIRINSVYRGFFVMFTCWNGTRSICRIFSLKWN